MHGLEVPMLVALPQVLWVQPRKLKAEGQNGKQGPQASEVGEVWARSRDDKY